MRIVLLSCWSFLILHIKTERIFDVVLTVICIKISTNYTKNNNKIDAKPGIESWIVAAKIECKI